MATSSDWSGVCIRARGHEVELTEDDCFLAMLGSKVVGYEVIC